MDLYEDYLVIKPGKVNLNILRFLIVGCRLKIAKFKFI